jgi:O-antigen/teichoic acid export membrane protein
VSGPGPLRSVTRGLIGVTGASWLGNVLSYLLVLIAARRLGSDDYAALITLINLLLVGSVPSFALQAVGARRMATGEERGLWQAGLLTGVGAGLLLIAISPLLRSFLHLSLVGLLLVAVALPATAMQGLCQGVVQGEQRFTGLAVITFVGIVGKSLAGLIGLVVFGTATGTMAAIAIGVIAAAAGSAIALPELRRRAHGGRRLLLPLIAEASHASHAYGIFLLLSVSDVLLARHVLPSRAAAVYAAGSVLTKGTLWLPQSVANVLFASLVDAERHRRIFAQAVAGIAAVAAAIALGCWPFGGIAATVVAGNRYPELGSEIWMFAVLGGCLAILQFTLVAGLAVRSLGVTVLIWLTVLAETVGAFSLGSNPPVRSMIGLMCLINVVSAAVAIGLRMRSERRARPVVVGAAGQVTDLD